MASDSIYHAPITILNTEAQESFPDWHYIWNIVTYGCARRWYLPQDMVTSHYEPFQISPFWLVPICILSLHSKFSTFLSSANHLENFQVWGDSENPQICSQLVRNNSGLEILKHVAGIWSGGSFERTEPLTCEVWPHLE